MADHERLPRRDAAHEGRRESRDISRRSRSPRERHRETRTLSRERERRRDRADEHEHSDHRRRRHRDHHNGLRPPPHGSSAVVKELPFSARRLSKEDYRAFKPLFARYLDVQKEIDLLDLDEREARGRWKSFVGKWNEGSLAQGWYDPEMFAETAQRWAEDGGEESRLLVRRKPKTPESHHDQGNGDIEIAKEDVDDDGSEDDRYGPTLPRSSGRTGRQGPGIPSLDDLQAQREMAEDDRADQREQLRLERKADRKEQKQRLEELVPRAEPGTRERQLEKKREVNDKMKQFREGSPGAAEVKDGDLMGGGEGVEDYKRAKASVERRKNEREVRREEIERARMAEREERLKLYREKEDRSMAALKEIAKQRFG